MQKTSIMIVCRNLFIFAPEICSDEMTLYIPFLLLTVLIGFTESRIFRHGHIQ